MRKLRIGNFLSHYPNPGGTSGTLSGLSGALADLGHEIIIYCCGRPGGSDVETHPQVRLFNDPHRSRNPFCIPDELQSRLWRNADQLELLLIHGFFNPANVTVAHAAKRGRIPYVSCPSGLYHAELLKNKRWTKALFGYICERPLLRDAAAVQVFGALQRNLIETYAPAHAPIFIVPNGFHPGEISDTSELPTRPEAQWRPGAIRLLFFGRIDMHTKGLDILLEALGRGLQEEIIPRNIELKLVGPDWGDRATLEALADKLGVRDSIAFTGLVENRTKWQVLSSCELLVMPSRHDAYPRAAVEAMVSGKPILISRNTSLADWVERERCGYTVEPTVESVLAGIRRALQERSCWSTLGDRAKAAAFRDLTWKQVAEEAARRYESIIDCGRSADQAAGTLVSA